VLVLILSVRIVGKGTGLFNKSSGQIEMMTELSFKYKQAVVIGEGKGVCMSLLILPLLTDKDPRSGLVYTFAT
jgi:hypothetical protein